MEIENKGECLSEQELCRLENLGSRTGCSLSLLEFSV